MAKMKNNPCDTCPECVIYEGWTPECAFYDENGLAYITLCGAKAMHRAPYDPVLSASLFCPPLKEKT
jgi:hypothetical protein